MPPAYVKPFVKRHKNDAADAEAICEAMMRPSMRFVPIKSPEQQSVLMLHRSRDLLMRQRTMVFGGSEGCSGVRAAQRSLDTIVGYKGLAHSPPTLKCQFWQVV